MIGTLVIVLLILAVGTRASDALEVRQQEIVLGKLPVPDAHDYYQRLRRRVWRARVLRAVAVLALITLAYTARRLLPVDSTPPPTPAPGAGAAGGAAHLRQRTWTAGTVFEVAEAAFHQPVKPSQSLVPQDRMSSAE